MISKCKDLSVLQRDFQMQLMQSCKLCCIESTMWFNVQQKIGHNYCTRYYSYSPGNFMQRLIRCRNVMSESIAAK